ncbi:MAG: hypothetical protein AAGL68_00070 [Pseudomonadota bacterium]
MIEGNINRHGDFDPDLFTEEELEMMQEADGVTDDLSHQPSNKELQAQYTAVARLVAEGGERERQLRAAIADLTSLLKASEQAASLQEQNQSLAKIVLASSEREAEIQRGLEELKQAVLKRASDAEDRKS